MSRGHAWTCPLQGTGDGHDAIVPTRGAKKWACPPGGRRGGLVVRVSAVLVRVPAALARVRVGRDGGT